MGEVYNERIHMVDGSTLPVEVEEFCPFAHELKYKVSLFQGGFYLADTRDNAVIVGMLSRILHFEEMD